MSEPVDEIELVPPSPYRVAARALLLSAITCRSGIDGMAGDAQAEQLNARILDWLTRLEIGDEIERHERELLIKPLGELSEEERVDASWQSEGLVILAWALQLAEPPPFDVQVDPVSVTDKLGFLTDQARRVLAAPNLRDAADLDMCSERQFAVYWRLRTFARDRRRIDFAEAAKGDAPDSEFGPMVIDGLPLIGGDLALKSRPLFQAEESDWRTALAIAEERLRAAYWLCGYKRKYSEIHPGE
jgi:hypothetical protein